MTFLANMTLAHRQVAFALAVLACSLPLCSLHHGSICSLTTAFSHPAEQVSSSPVSLPVDQPGYSTAGALLMQNTFLMNDSAIVIDRLSFRLKEMHGDLAQLAAPEEEASPSSAPDSLPRVEHSKPARASTSEEAADGLQGDPLEPGVEIPKALAVAKTDAEKIEDEEWGSGTLADTKKKMNENKSSHGTAGTHGKKRHGYLALLFFFVALLIGSFLLWALERHLPSVPYTCALFLAGAIMMFITEAIPKNGTFYWTSWMASVDMWKDIDPHMLFFTFLPALIFAEAMKLNVPLFKKCFKQVFLLACPGLLFGTASIAAFSVYILPYGWDWPIALVFGCILSATDPVAVVALFGTLGVSPRLTMLISGESLLNDGTAMVVFTLMLKVTLGVSLHWNSVLAFFARMSIISCLLGALLGFLSVIFIGMCAEESYHSDTMIQVIITISCAFLTFFMAESELASSGMLATVASGVTVATYAWPRFVSKTAVHTVWEAIEFIGNTLIFFLAGLLFANLCITRREHLQWTDLFWLLVLWPVVILIRALMLALLWLPLRAAGTPIDWREGIVIVWSGLRGAVGLAMAIIVDSEPAIPTRMGSRVMFLVGGLAGLTTVVNATTTPLLLHYLGLSSTHSVKEKIIARFKQSLSDETEEAFKKHMQAKNEFTRANTRIVKEMVPCLKAADTFVDLIPTFGHVKTVSGKDPKGTREGDKQLERICRETFLQLLQTHYWSLIEEGLIGRNSTAARLLLVSVNEALDNTGVSLNDWEIIAQNLNPNHVIETVAQDRMRCVSTDSVATGVFTQALGLEDKAEKADTLFAIYFPQLHRLIDQEEPSEVLAYVALAFIAAHKKALEELPEYFEGDTGSRESSLSGEDLQKLRKEDELLKLAVAHVKWESKRECIRVEEVLKELQDDAEVAESEMLASKLLHGQISRIEELVGKGVLSHKEGATLESEVHKALRKMVRQPRSMWIRLLHCERKSDCIEQQQRTAEEEEVDEESSEGEDENQRPSRMPLQGSPFLFSPEPACLSPDDSPTSQYSGK